ncbi:MAG TPA: RcnB family protein [Dyella sp.]|uniref:RcnB family protein n=1 Tax=Dyella sp. TaxID=1869338 RepID=UPI002B51FEB5|nr:RcnB family protein [Dyella sp.]HUB89864.1 RcnB family protein [Dyella sp.]
MKRHLLALALLSSLPLVMTATAASAQDYQDHGDHDHGSDQHGDHHDDRDHHDHDDHGRHDDHDRGWHDDHGHHVGWDRHYRRGEYLPERYRAREYYVDDYARYHLYAPPRGYVWVHGDEGQFVLVAVATGLIVNELLGN